MSTIDELPPPRHKKHSRLMRWVYLVLIAIGLTYLIGVVLLYCLQDWLIFPGKMTQGTRDAEFRAPVGCEMVQLKTKGGERVVALFGPAMDRVGRPVVNPHSYPTFLFFYGNGECISRDLRLFAEFRRLGVNVMIPDYLGYGLSGGKASESGCYATADAAFDHLLARPDVDPSRIFAMGWSLGGAVAIDLASRKPVAGLAVFCTFTSMSDMVGERYPFVPKFLLSHKFESLAKIAKVGCPILIGHGRLDGSVPFIMAGKLAKSAVKSSGLRLLEVDGADHNDFFEIGAAKVAAGLRKLADGEP